MKRSDFFSRSLGYLLTGAAIVASTAAACTSGGHVGDGTGTTGNGNGPQGGCPGDLAFFEANVWKPILEQKCLVCHSEGGLAGESALRLLSASEEGYLEKNFEVVRELAGVEVDGTSVLLLRPSGRHPEGHTGGELVPFNGPPYKTLATFVSRVTEGKNCDSPVAGCTTATPGGRILRRLSRSEYDRTVHDLLGVESSYGASFTSDTVVNGFDNNAAALRPSPLLADQIRRAAEEIAATVMKNPGALLPFDPAAGDAACAEKLLVSLGKRAFRRPLDSSDRARYLGLYQGVAAAEGFSSGVEAVIAALLQSPYFLYRSELGAAPDGAGRVQLSPWEIASELSYFLWGSMPDAELFAAAESGALSSPEEIEKQARRLLSNPRSDETVAHFVGQWLEIDRLPNVPKDAAAYPGFDAGLRAQLSEETRRFVDHVLREGSGTLSELLTADYSFLSPELAAFYGLPAPSGEGFSRVDLPGSGRSGLLTQGSVLATHAKPADSSPIHRGKLVRERLLCQALPPPPPGLNVQPPPVDPTLTTRERYAAHATMEPCLSCHTMIDPIGFGFEHFDGIGRYRAMEGGKAIDAGGQIVATTGTDGTFDGTVELGAMLAQSPDVERCFALQWMRFGYGLTEDANLSCLVEQVGMSFDAGGQQVSELIVALTRTAHFTERLADPGIDGSSGGSGGGGGSGAGGNDGIGGGAGTGGGAPLPVGELLVESKIDSQWGSGYCSTVTVENQGPSPVIWSVTLEIEGTITDLWNAVSTPAGSKLAFSGKDYNASLDPMANTSFGFCASK